MKNGISNPPKNAGGRQTQKTAAQSQKPPADQDGVPRFMDEPDLAYASLILRSPIVRERQVHLYRTIYVLTGLLGLSIFAIVVLTIRPNNPIVIGATTDGRILPIIPLNRPIMSTSAMANWVANAVTSTFTISFAHTQRDLQAAQQFYTDDGWANFQAGAISSKFLSTVVDNKYDVYAVTKEAPTMISQPGAVDKRGVAYWIWQVPITVTFESAVTKYSLDYVVTVTVERVPEAQNPTGLGISGLAEQ